MAICTGSPAESFRVRLLSTAQAEQAPTIANDPHGTPESGRPSHERDNPPIAISVIPHAMRLSTCSRKANHAMRAVRTPSRFSSKDAVEAGVTLNPHMSRSGPITPPLTIAPANHRVSARVNEASPMPRSRRPLPKSQHTPKPTPELKYSSPANKTGSIPGETIFASGVLSPNKAAAKSAQPTPV